MHPNSLLTIDSLRREEIIDLLNDAYCFSNLYKDWHLSTNGPIANLFFENSTRTHYSFASAELQLGLKVEDMYPEFSSLTKGESLYDTCKTFEAIGYKALVIRNKQDEYFKGTGNFTCCFRPSGIFSSRNFSAVFVRRWSPVEFRLECCTRASRSGAGMRSKSSGWRLWERTPGKNGRSEAFSCRRRL